MNGCANSCEKFQGNNKAKPGDQCTIWEGMGGCNSTQIKNDGKDLYTQWWTGSGTYHCDGKWRKDGGGTTGAGTYRCSKQFTKEECLALEFDQIEGYWQYDPDASTVGGESKTNTTVHKTESSWSHEYTEKLSTAMKSKGEIKLPIIGKGMQGETTASLSLSNTNKFSNAIADETESSTTVGGDCPRSVWRWVFAGTHGEHPECNVSVKPGAYTAYTNSPTDPPCCLPDNTICDTNEHNPCKDQSGFMCEDLFKNDRNNCTKSCRSLAVCKDTERGACPT